MKHEYKGLCFSSLLCALLGVGCVTENSLKSTHAQPAPIRTAPPSPTVVAPAVNIAEAPGAFDDLIKWTLAPSDMPRKWLRPGINPEIRTIEDAKQKEYWAAVVNRVLTAYPPETLRKCMDSLVIVEFLKLKNIAAAGYAADRQCFIAVSNRIRPRTVESVESTIHHELSSLLLDKHFLCLSEWQWKLINPKDFQYLGWSGVSNSAVLDSSEAMKEDGFFRRYAKSSVGNDFNTIAEYLFMGSEELWSDVERHPRIRKKVDLTIDVYECIDKSFSRQFFLSRRATVDPEILGQPE